MGPFSEEIHESDNQSEIENSDDLSANNFNDAIDNNPKNLESDHEQLEREHHNQGGES